MATSLIYSSASIYEMAMLVLYGRHYPSRYRALAELIPRGSSVLDLCCGPALLYGRHLRHKAVQYTGVDVNARFIKRLIRRGGRGEVRDLRKNVPLPPADYVIMQSSLYHFLPDASPIVDRMLEAARKQVIIAEPVRNLATSRSPLLRFLGRGLTDPGIGKQPHRFTNESLDELFSAYRSRIERSFLIAGGREKVYVLNK